MAANRIRLKFHRSAETLSFGWNFIIYGLPRRDDRIPDPRVYLSL